MAGTDHGVARRIYRISGGRPRTVIFAEVCRFLEHRELLSGIRDTYYAEQWALADAQSFAPPPVREICGVTCNRPIRRHDREHPRESQTLGNQTSADRSKRLRARSFSICNVTCPSHRAAFLCDGSTSEAIMTDIAATIHAPDLRAADRPKLDTPANPLAMILFFGFLAAGILYMAYSIYVDVGASGTQTMTYLPYLLLFVALLIALGFEFVNGFHDTANAVATVIHTHSLPAPFAVVWAGFFNFLGVVLSSGAVAFGIISLLPVELILQVGTSAGFAMVFALLFAAIIWNLGTWWLGLPASSSHTLIGSIIGVGVANALMHGQDGTTGVDWSKATEIGWSLLLSPLFGFFAAALLLLALKVVVRNPALYQEPKGNQPPPWWIRATLIATCTGVSFAHGSNDGQKGMGLIMLILIGTVPTAYALNRAMPASQMEEFQTNSAAAAAIVRQKGPATTSSATPARPSPSTSRAARSTKAPTRRYPL